MLFPSMSLFLSATCFNFSELRLDLSAVLFSRGSAISLTVNLSLSIANFLVYAQLLSPYPKIGCIKYMSREEIARFMNASFLKLSKSEKTLLILKLLCISVHFKYFFIYSFFNFYRNGWCKFLKEVNITY